jgi:peptidoglycan/xylan/chitin deacetylase (PgdA/CDA1 family)
MTVSITVDVDGEAGLPDGGRGYAQRLSSRSERLYGLRRGLPRILSVLARFDLAATFYVPGVVAQRHPDEIRGVLEAGHELGHHGHTHRRPDGLAAADQRAELVDGLAALAELGGGGPVRGYRAPGWELTPATVRALGELGFTHDSSLMGDDRPYRVGDLVELPVHWTLDDAPHFERTTDPEPLLRCWLDELACAVAEERHITFTLHPEILGRPYRVALLERLLEAVRKSGAEHITHARAAQLAPR